MSKFTSDEWITDDFGEHVFRRIPFVAELIEIAKTPGWAYLAEKFKLEQDEAISLQKAIGRLLAAASEMYRLLQNFAYPEEPITTRTLNLSNRAWELLRRIDGKEAEHE